jgi:peptidoglycan hydrolase-like protein with peptidoglycan-binding domain
MAGRDARNRMAIATLVYAGPVDGELNAQTEAALRQYQQQHGLPVSGTVDEASLQQLQLRLPTTPGGER